MFYNKKNYLKISVFVGVHFICSLNMGMLSTQAGSTAAKAAQQAVATISKNMPSVAPWASGYQASLPVEQKMIKAELNPQKAKQFIQKLMQENQPSATFVPQEQTWADQQRWRQLADQIPNSTSKKSFRNFTQIPAITPVEWSQKRNSGFSSSRSSSYQQNEKSWWQNRKLKYGVLGAAGLFKGIQDFDKWLIKYKKKLLKEVLDNSDDLAVVDPEFYKVCQQIKKDYGITEDVHFRVKHDDYKKDDNSGAAYSPGFKMILLERNYKKNPKSWLIFAIAHELEHHRQFNQYPGSYHFQYVFFDKDKAKDMQRKLETAADAAALDYVYCPKCLAFTSHSQLPVHDPEETKYGYFTSKEGYATKQDIELYRKRVLSDDPYTYCPAHTMILFDDSFHFSDERDYPLKDFLPTIKPSLPTAKFSDPAEE